MAGQFHNAPNVTTERRGLTTPREHRSARTCALESASCDVGYGALDTAADGPIKRHTRHAVSVGLDRDWCTEAAFLLGNLVPGASAVRPLKIPFETDECEWFVRGWEAGLYPVTSCPVNGLKDTCTPDRADHFLTTSGRHRHLLTRWTEGGWGTLV